MNIFKEFLNTWYSDYKRQFPVFFLEGTGTLVSMLASGLLAGFATQPPMWIIFGLWLYGAIAMATAFYLRRNGSAMVLMLWYVGINITGLMNLFFNSGGG